MRLPLLSLSLVVVLGVGCSNPSPEDAPTPTPQSQIKKRTQALGAVTLREVPVASAILLAAGENATVRAFVIESAQGEYTVDEVVAAAFQQGASDPVNLPWQAGLGRNREETRTSLQYLNELVPAIEAHVGTVEEYSTGYFHWFRTRTEETCDLGDLYIPVLNGQVFVVEAKGITEC